MKFQTSENLLPSGSVMQGMSKEWCGIVPHRNQPLASSLAKNWHGRINLFPYAFNYSALTFQLLCTEDSGPNGLGLQEPLSSRCWLGNLR